MRWTSRVLPLAPETTRSSTLVPGRPLICAVETSADLPGDRVAVDGDDQVARLDPGPLGGRAGDHARHPQAALDLRHREADARELPGARLLELAQLMRVEVVREAVVVALPQRRGPCRRPRRCRGAGRRRAGSSCLDHVDRLTEVSSEPPIPALERDDERRWRRARSAAPARKPTIRPRRRSVLIASSRRLRPGSNAEEAAQRDAAAERRDHHRRADEQRDERSEADGREVVDQGEVLRERIDDRHLAEPEDADGDAGARAGRRPRPRS